MKRNRAMTDRELYLATLKKEKRFVSIHRAIILVVIIAVWELFARLHLIDSFIMSQPSRIAETFVNMVKENLILHIYTTCYETIVGFALGIILGIAFAILLWWFETLAKICDPYIVVLNALPKIALGPVIIVLVGAGTEAIIFMALAISLIVTIMQMYNGFKNTNKEKCKMLQSFGANKFQVLTKIVIPSNISTLFTSMKINIGLSLVGVIAGEFLVSKAGLGYLIVYGGQVFRMDLVMTSVFILAIVASFMYIAILVLEKWVIKYFSHN